MKRPLQLPLAIALALGGTNALALGLGPVHVKSKLNQPLDAEIPVIQGTAGEAEGLLVNLAGDDDFQRIGLSRAKVGVPLEFALGKGANGETVIRVTSKEPVREPYLDFLVEANWPKGRLLREYTVLLDPPVTAPGSRSATTAALPASPATTKTAKAEKPEKPASHATAAATPAPAPAPAPHPSAKPPREAAPATKAKDGEYGPVEAGQTLSEVAREARPNGNVNLNQMMLALLKSNPNAFYKNNINALKRGAILRVPSADEIKAVGSASDAATQVNAQVEDWRGGRASPTLVADAGSKPAAPTATSAPTAKPAKSTAATGKDSGEHLALVPPKAGKDSLAMADRPGSGAGSAAASGELKSELARTKEALATRDQETGELKSRVKELEDLKGKNDRLISLKDSEIAELQQKLKQLQDKGAASTAPATKPATATGSAPATATPPATAPAATTPAAHPAATTTPTATSAPVIATGTTPAPAAAKIDKQDIWGGDASKNAAPAAKPATAAGTPAGATSSTPAAPAPAAAANAPASTNTAPAASAAVTTTPLATTPSTTTTPAPTHAAEAPKPAAVKPTVATAKPKPAPVVATPWYEEMWVKAAALAAGVILLLLGLMGLRKRKPAAALPRGGAAAASADAFTGGPGAGLAGFETEEANLREHLQHDPSNVGLHLELLSLYYAERDVGKFEQQASEMHAHVTDRHQPEWMEAQAMGQELAPHNPLFAGDEYEHAASPDAYADTFERPAFEHEATGPVHGHEAAPAAHADADLAFDFSHDDLAPAMSHPATNEASPAPKGFDFDDLPPLDFEQPARHSGEAFDQHEKLMQHEPVIQQGHAMQHEPAAPAHLDDEFFSGDDAIGTKLDLAKAYMDMGDPDGARSMLEEVVAEGNEAQKSEAHRLMAELR